MVNDANIDKLRESVRGEVLGPNDEGFQSAR